jgi:hypothetical protein
MVSRTPGFPVVRKSHFGRGPVRGAEVIQGWLIVRIAWSEMSVKTVWRF